MIDGDGHSAFENKDLTTHVCETLPYELPQEVVDFRKSTMSDLELRKSRGEAIPWNGDTLSLYKYIVSRAVCPIERIGVKTGFFGGFYT